EESTDIQKVNLTIKSPFMYKEHVSLKIPLDNSVPIDVLYQSVRTKLKLDPSDILIIYRNNEMLKGNIEDFRVDNIVAFIDKSEQTSRKIIISPVLNSMKFSYLNIKSNITNKELYYLVGELYRLYEDKFTLYTEFRNPKV